jgi:hypothetical protein
MTIATMGPFWGAIGLEEDLAANAWEIQHKYFGIQIDERWSQTAELLREYYKRYAGALETEPTLMQIGGAKADQKEKSRL